MSLITWSEFTTSPWGKDFVSGNVVPSGFQDELVATVSEAIEDYCGRKFELTTGLVYKLRGRDNYVFFLPAFPVSGMISVSGQVLPGQSSYLQDLAIVDTTPTAYAVGDFVFDSNTGKVNSPILLRNDTLYTVTYNGGYAAANMPRPLKQAAMMLAQIEAEAADLGMTALPEGVAMTTMKFGKFGQGFSSPQLRYLKGDDAMPLTVASKLKKYRALM